MVTFHYRSERNHFIKNIKKMGLFNYFASQFESEVMFDLFNTVWDEAFDRLSDLDKEAFNETLYENISWDNNDIWEVYLDKSETKLTNDNYSMFIVSDHMPTREQALKLLKDSGKLDEGYHIRFIQESDWDDEYIDESDYLYLL